MSGIRRRGPAISLARIFPVVSAAGWQNRARHAYAHHAVVMPQLYAYFKLAGFSPPQILTEPLSKPKYFHERLLGLPGKLYCRRRARKALDDEARQFWQGPLAARLP